MHNIDTVPFPSLEAAVSALCEKTFGAKLILLTEAAPTTEHSELNQWEENRAKDGHIIKLLGDKEHLTEQRDRYMRCSQSLEKQNTELEMKWHGAAADASELREEVKRLTEQRDGHHRNVAAYAEFTRNVATALGMGTFEISFDEVLKKIEETKSSEGQVEFHHKAWVGAVEQIKTLTAERNTLHAERDKLKAELAEATEYRDLTDKDTIREGDEMLSLGREPWEPTVFGYLGAKFHPDYGRHRRRITPA